MAAKLIDRRVTVTAKFINARSQSPLNGDNYEFRLFDKDLITDDFLGVSKLNTEGEAKLSFGMDKFNSLDSPMETKPDLWFRLMNGDQEVYRSKVIENIDLTKYGDLTVEGGYTFDLGTYII